MMIDENIIDKWRKEIHTRKCPQCGHLTLQIEPGKGKIHCTECNFSEDFPVMSGE